MKRIVSIVLLIIGLQNIYAQDSNMPTTSVSGIDITGRWMEEKRHNINNDSIEIAHPYIYFFKKDMVFHRGEVSDGAILFNVTGKYTITDNKIEAHYYDFSTKGSGINKSRTMTFEIKNISDSIMNVEVQESRYRKYLLKLRKQEF